MVPSRGGGTQRDQKSPGTAVGILSESSVGADQTCSRLCVKLSTGRYSFGVALRIWGVPYLHTVQGKI